MVGYFFSIFGGRPNPTLCRPFSFGPTGSQLHLPKLLQPQSPHSTTVNFGDAPELSQKATCLNHFVLIEVASVDLLVVCLRIITPFVDWAGLLPDLRAYQGLAQVFLATFSAVNTGKQAEKSPERVVFLSVLRSQNRPQTYKALLCNLLRQHHEKWLRQSNSPH